MHALPPDSQAHDSSGAGPTGRAWLLTLLLGSALLPTGFVTALYLWAGRAGAEKAATRFIQPDGLLWSLGLGVVLVLARRDRVGFRLAAILWLAVTLVGNPWLVSQAALWLEGPYADDSPYRHETPFEQVVVLGGGTTFARNGLPQLDASGDRVALAARLYHTGRARQIVCTGEPIEGLSDPTVPSAAEQTRQILVELGVPDTAILKLGGRNTSDEMAALRELLSQREAGEAEESRTGLITSAWHLPRALVLAEAQGLDLVPLAADDMTRQGPFTPLDLIPSAGALDDLNRLWKELVARGLGR